MNFSSESPVEMPAELSLDAVAEMRGEMDGHASGNAGADAGENAGGDAGENMFGDRVEESAAGTVVEAPFAGAPVVDQADVDQADVDQADVAAVVDARDVDAPDVDAPVGDPPVLETREEKLPEAVPESASDAPPEGVKEEVTAAKATKDPMEVLIPDAPALQLTGSGIARSLVALRAVEGGVTASYERIAGKILVKSWNRTSLFFTSAQAGDGSTEAAVNLATMLSRRAESVLLVDLQLAGPAIGSLLGKPEVKVGFDEALQGQASFGACVHQIAGEKLQVLLMKQAMTLEESAHCSGALNDFLEWAEERFAWIIIDCPPVLAPLWTRWFALNADPAVLVARSGKTTKHDLHLAARRLGDRLAGTILSDTQPDPPLEQSRVVRPRDSVFLSQLKASGSPRR